jgi:penicillin amidase
MRIVRFISVALLTFLVLFLMNRVAVINNTAIPPLGKLLDPVNGFWINAEKDLPRIRKSVISEHLHGEVTVKYDERWVPHIFTTDTRDAYFAQGYVTAAHRLWQMEFQTHAAAGRLSEILYHTAGDRVLQVDRLMRRNGLKRAAEKSLEAFERDPEANMIVTAYTEGVNAYVESLRYRDFPVEFKLLDYRPEKWSKLKSALLLKYMAHMLTGESDDIALTAQLNQYGADFVNLFYPDFPADLSDPIVPSGTSFESDPALQKAQAVDSASVPAVSVSRFPFPKIPEGYGSNNWAVSGEKTKTGKPMLANDPHLQLNFPSIWFEMQLSSPDFNVYGVTLPGAPAVIIGFNNAIAWGVTNGTRDVKDWYKLKFKDADRKQYLVDGKWEDVVLERDTFYLRGESEPFIDEVIHTRFGTVIYDKGMSTDESAADLACTWIAEEPANELFTFVKLNRAKTYADYTEALTHFNCPAQNFIFASRSGDIAIWQQGGLYAHTPGQGRFVQEGTSSASIWNKKVAPAYTPHVKNPLRGFVSSANQHPTDSIYPYYYNGRFEYFRNRRINAELTRLSQITAEDMMRLQNDNYNLIAAEALPFLLESLNERNAGKAYAVQAGKWNYMNDADLEGPAIFESWWKNVEKLMFEELINPEKEFQIPQQYNIIRVMKKNPDHAIFDYVPTSDKKETVPDLVNMAFEKTCMELDSIRSAGKPLNWAAYKQTSVQHLLFTLKPFGRFDIPIGGGKHIVNACAERWGPSWRMIVSLEDDVKAYGVYPGGQSGNPGSRYYDNFIDRWAEGKYYSLWFMSSEEDGRNPVLFTQKMYK